MLAHFSQRLVLTSFALSALCINAAAFSLGGCTDSDTNSDGDEDPDEVTAGKTNNSKSSDDDGGAPRTAPSAPSNSSSDDGFLAPEDEQDAGSNQPSAPPPVTDVNVIITADNAYGFGYGTSDELLNYFGGVENVEAEEIFDCPVGFGPESYVVPAEDANVGGFLYVITYADDAFTQGVIAKFFREGADPVFTGNGNWEVCATGIDYDLGAGGPPLAEINTQIENCNEGDLDPDTTSGGWVGTDITESGGVVFGEDNTTPRDTPTVGNEFPLVCDIDEEARWMWYEWLPDRDSSSAFIWPREEGNPTRDFLIFRLGAEFVPLTPRVAK